MDEQPSLVTLLLALGALIDLVFLTVILRVSFPLLSRSRIAWRPYRAWARNVHEIRQQEIAQVMQDLAEIDPEVTENVRLWLL